MTPCGGPDRVRVRGQDVPRPHDHRHAGAGTVAVASSRAADVHADHPGIEVVNADRLIARGDVDLVVIPRP